MMRFLSQFAYRSVEFSTSLPFADLASLPSPHNSRLTHYVLPDLPGIVTDEVKRAFRRHTTSPNTYGSTAKPIVTIAVSLYNSPASLISASKERVEMYGAGEDTLQLLVVGGNTAGERSITTPEALKILRDAFPSDAFQLFCSWDPNCAKDSDYLLKKIDAGATGIITQPPLTSVAWNQLDECCSLVAPADDGIDLIPGVALPKSSKQLIFWSTLLKEPDVARNDDLFCNALNYFNNDRASLFDKAAERSWVTEQRDRLLSSYNSIAGLHFMPLGNNDDLLRLMKQ